MANVTTPTRIIPPRVPFIDERTGLISREWYLFLLNLFGDNESAAQVAMAALFDAQRAAEPSAAKAQKKADDAYLLGMLA